MAAANGRPVTQHDWHRWRWQSALAFAALAAANAYGFWLLQEEHNDRVRQAAIVIAQRCKVASENRGAIIRVVRFERAEDEHADHKAQLDALIRSIPQITPAECARQSRMIRRLVG